MRDALEFFDPDVLSFAVRVRDAVKQTLRILKMDFSGNPEHKLARFIRFCLKEDEHENLPDLITRAAKSGSFGVIYDC